MRRLTLFIPLLCLSVLFSSNSVAQQCTQAHLTKVTKLLDSFEKAVSEIPRHKLANFTNISSVRSQLGNLKAALSQNPASVSVAHFNSVRNETRGLMKTFKSRFMRWVWPNIAPSGLLLWHAFDSLLELW